MAVRAVDSPVLPAFPLARKRQRVELPCRGFLVFSCLFLFYVVNYRTLVIQVTSETLILSFGIFTWTVPFDNIESCASNQDRDHSPRRA